MTTKGTLRCAIYTRKSTEEGLDQSFNSLDAQREACSAYIKSQAGEGWKLVPTKYDDGGFSGGTMDRPALQRLLADIDHGRTDCVVVYKIDRLTRSLADFAKIVECFDQRKVTFVSVTQSFNTTTSMGRLTLNVLLSFAQFEREVAAERIRDKFAASRAKGIFMGGTPPLGYDARDRRLVVNQAEAKTVRFIFRRYLDLKSVGKLREELEAKRITTKSFVSTRGKTIGGGQWYVGPLRHLLRNSVYAGFAKHRGTLYPGEHEPIVEKSLFNEVQAQLDVSARATRRQRTVEASGLLTGLIFDDRGNRMSPQWSIGRGGTKHGYYVSQALLQRRKANAGSLPRVAAPMVEDLAIQCLAALKAVPDVPERKDLAAAIHATLVSIVIGAQRVVVALKSGSRVAGKSAALVDQSALPKGAQVSKTADGVQVVITRSLKRRGGRKAVEGWTSEDWRGVRQRVDHALLSALARAHRWRDSIERGAVANVQDLAGRNAINRRKVLPLLRLAFLAPDVQSAIAKGHQPVTLNLKRLTECNLPSDWQKQRRLLGLVD